ncbi:NAD(P)-dependent oxidoreductase [Thermopolyspora flexuosa]|jgi:NAD(P)H dehydrogenase (quinone)|uniref:NAD(P)H dehydrogenase (Quinone) n=1 Tax=Thermopolyspora flexuosa TaxID=103836 RepID=A0A543J0S5_9ACTN|nr:SDR family oxidoreductase [Thermopolyspora flexuosa]TQM76424.1 NAD(P)H dehydrogenase (quinone) [Thermopolyspora flexuosa]GGM67420.1 NAD(P)-dependent oxidoreductase [Thermopolyspora flexuosa]
MTIAITGASGGLGRSTAERLLQLTDPRDVVLTTRNPDALADLAERGAQVRRVDFNEPGTFATAFAGVERLLLISTDAIGARLDQHRAAIAGAAEAGVRHIVYTSVPEPVPGNPALVVPDHAGTEQALRESGLKWTMLRNNLYAHMQVPAIQQMIATGRYVTNTGDGATAYVTREDCAAVAAAVLTQDGHEDRAYDVTGPEAFTAADLAALAEKVGGRPVETAILDDDELTAQLQAAGLPPAAAQAIVSFGAATRLGYLSRVTSVVPDLTGRPATPLADLLKDASPAS